VQWDDQLGLGLLYMHARHYSPALGRFLQPDPDRSEANLYAYAANNPVTELDPDGTCFIVCAVANALLDTAIYFATTDRSQWSLQGAASAAAVGAVTGFLGVGLISKVAKIGVMARAASKIASKVPTATRAVKRIVSATRKVDQAAIRSAAKHRLLPDAVQRIGKHAAQRMSQRGVTRKMVDVAVRKGERYWDPLNRSVAHVMRGGMASGRDLLVGRNPVTGRITTTIVGRRLIRARMERLK